jgi:hypothetical protein
VISWLMNFILACDLIIFYMILPLKPKYLSYKVDGIVIEQNRNILWLPPYHPELKPTELIWATIKIGLLKTIPHLGWMTSLDWQTKN